MNPDGSYKTTFVVEIDDGECTVQEKKMIEDFALREIYAYHGELEGKDIYLWRLNNSSTYLNGLFTTTLQGFTLSTEEIFRMFFGTEYYSRNTLNRPFSKLKRDLLQQIGLLDDSGNFIP